MDEITKTSNPELFEELREVCEFDCSHVPKHGSGEVNIYATRENGDAYEAEGVWDYSWGVEWDCVTFTKVDKIVKTCPCCGKPIDE